MPAARGSYNARGYHEQGARRLLNDLEKQLARIPHGVVFRNVTALSEHVAGACGQTAGNLRRNKSVRVMLDNFLVRQSGAASVMSEQTREVSVLRAKLRLAQLEASNAGHEKRRLERYIASHIALTAPGSTMNRQVPSPKRTADKDDYVQAFTRTAQALLTIIERAEFFTIDTKAEAVIDESARPDQRVVVSSNLATPFIKWYRAEKTVK